MDNKSTNGTDKSSLPTAASCGWGDLEAWVRAHVQRFVQGLLEDEVTELLGRPKHGRRAAVDAPAGYRNGSGKTRRLTLSCGTIELRRPRVRGLEARFESQLLPLFAKRSSTVSELLPELYLHGLALGDFELALRGLLGDGASLSPSTIARLKQKWQSEYEAWGTQRLDQLEPVYLWVDGVYVKAGLEKDKAALLVAIAGCSDGRKELVALVAGHRESEAAWSSVLRDLKRRGLRCPKLVVGDGHLDIWAGLRNVYPEAAEQRCWNHRILNVLDKVPKKRQAQVKLQLKQIPYAASEREALELRERFQAWCRTHGLDEAAALIPPKAGLGPDGRVLPLPARALDASSHHRRGRVAVRRAARSDRRRQALQEGRERHRGDLQDAAGSRDEVPAPQRTRTASRARPGRRVQRRTTNRTQHPGGRRLKPIYTLLDKTSQPAPLPIQRLVLHSTPIVSALQKASRAALNPSGVAASLRSIR